MLAGHIVSGCQHLLKGRSAQHETPAFGVGDYVSEIGMPAGDEFKAEGRSGLCDMLAKPVGQAFGIDAGRQRVAGWGGRCFRAGFWHKKILDGWGSVEIAWESQREFDASKFALAVASTPAAIR